MNYLSDTVTLSIAHPGGYSAGDYLLVYGNEGDGSIDYTTTITPKYDLTASSPISVTVWVDQAGIWSFGVESYDSLGNASGTPCEDNVLADLTPEVPAIFACDYTAGTFTFT